MDKFGYAPYDPSDPGGKPFIDHAVEIGNFILFEALLNPKVVDKINIIHLNDIRIANFNSLDSDMFYKFISVFFSCDRINKHIYINKRDEYNNTLLHMAFTKKSFNAVRLLISNGASFNIPDNKGDTAEHIAMRILNDIPDDYIDVLIHMEKAIDKAITNAAGETTETIRMSTCRGKDCMEDTEEKYFL